MIRYINYAKVIGILLMIIGHIWTVDPTIRQFIYSFHMPLFFIMAGFLYKRVPIKERLRKDWRALLLPFFLVNLICMVIRLLIPTILEPGYEVGSHFLKQMGAILVGESIPSFGLEPVCGPSWFILAIFYLHMLSYLLPEKDRYPQHFFASGWVLVAVTVVTSWTLSNNNINLPGPIDSAVMAFPFFWFGLKLRRLDNQFRPFSTARLLALIGACIATTLILSRLNGNVDINALKFGNNLTVYYLCGVIGSLMVIFICILVEQKNLVRREAFPLVISSGTIVIVGFHRFFIAVFEIVTSGLWKEIIPWISIIYAAVILIAFYPIILLCKRYFPALTGYR